MKIYAISGLGADKRVFDKIKDYLDIEVLDWLKPEKDEPIKTYSKRMAAGINASQPFCLIGVSFGGLIAIEIGEFLSPEHIFLISSAQNSNELRIIYKLLHRTKIHKIIPEKLIVPPAFILLPFLGAKNKQLAREILFDMDSYFTKWASGELIKWNNISKQTNVIKIHGDKDILMPLRETENTIVIPGGKHFMIVDEARRIIEEINKFTNN